MHHDFYQVQRTAITLAVLAGKLEAKKAAALLSRLDKAERDDIELDLSAEIPR